MSTFKGVFSEFSTRHRELKIDSDQPSEHNLQTEIDFGPNGNAIIVMGASGTGKSSFISLLAGEKVGGDHTLQPFTNDIGDDQSVYLIDSPAFDDIHTSDTEVLRKIAGYLGFVHKRKIRISGIIYLHRITDARIQGPALRNLKMSRLLWGDSVLGSVMLVTSWWNEVDPELGEEREEQLRKKRHLWGEMVKKHSEVARHNGTKETALAIVNSLLSKNLSVVLDIQDQMMNQRRHLHETTAGKEVFNQLSEALLQTTMKKKMALRERDDGADIFRKIEAKLEIMNEDHGRLQEKVEALIMDVGQATQCGSFGISQEAKDDG